MSTPGGAAPGGGQLWSRAWKWFDEKAAVKEVQETKAQCTGHLPTLADDVKEVYQGLPDVSGSVICVGCTGYIGEAVVFEAARRGLTVTVVTRQKTVERFTKVLTELKIQDRVKLAIADVTDVDDIEKAMKDAKADCCISLLASAQVDDEQSIYDIDRVASFNVVQAARKSGIKHFIYCSDYGCYQPALACQMHKLHVEGELMRGQGSMQYTSVRPPTYPPYVVQAMVLDQVQKGEAVPLFGSADDAGDLAVYNPIAREDLGRFMVSCVLNKGAYGRILPVGGPWTPENVCTLKDTTNWLIELCPEVKKPSTIKPLGMKLATIIYEALEALGVVSKAIKRVATIVFYYTKYWSTVTHFAPATGVENTKDYAKVLVDAVKADPEGFKKFIAQSRSTTGSTVFPTPRNSWWDITKKSLLPEQIPMGAGKPSQSSKEAVLSQDDEAALAGLQRLAPTMPLGFGNMTKKDEDDTISDIIDSDSDQVDEWVNVQGAREIAEISQ